MIIGLTGRNASGKGTVANWLVARGYHYASLSDAIRTWLAEQGREPTRDNMTAAGRQLRSEGGAGVLAKRTLPTLPAGQPCVIDSIRNPAEVEVLRRHPRFRLVEIAADERVRYERLRSRGRAGDAQSFEEFRRQEAAELTSASAAGQQLIATAALADERIANDGSEAELLAALQTCEAIWRTNPGR